jgi:hypothetical protein
MTKIAGGRHPAPMTSGRPAALVAALARHARAPVDDALLLALAFLVKNRLARAGTETLEARLPVTAGAPASRALRAAAEAALARAYSGEAADPTKGATELHRHEEAPDWAERLEATALIGPYLFLAAPSPAPAARAAPVAPAAPAARRESPRAEIHP